MLTRSKMAYILFFILIIITALQFSSFGISEGMYEPLRNLIVGVIVVVFLLSFNRTTISYLSKINILKIHTIVLSFSVIVLILISAFNVSDVRISPIRDLAVSLAILMIGINMSISKKQFNSLLYLFVILYTVSALSIVFTYAQGFIINEFYLPIPKNQFAPAFGSALILSLYLLLKKGTKFKVVLLTTAFLLFASLLIIRGRSVVLAVFLTIMLFLLFYVRRKGVVIATIILAMASLPFIWQYVYDALFLNYDISDLNSISTGRHERNIEGFSFLLQYPLFGELEAFFKGSTIHNYILYIVVSYGILLGGVALSLYFKYIIVTIKAIRRNTYQYYEVGPLVMVILLVVSLLEYTYPYSPGSAVFFPFFLLGQYLKIEIKKN